MGRLVAPAQSFQFLEQFLLALGQVDWGFHHDMALQVAVYAAAHSLDALAAQAEHLAGLGFRRDLDLGVAVQRRDLDFATQRCRGEADRHFAVQVVMVALENRVCFDLDHHVEVARRTAIDTGFAFA